MKTIEEQAREYAQNHYSGDGWFSSREDVEAAFIDGYEAATRWIRVDDKLPDPEKCVICLSKDGKIHCAYRIEESEIFQCLGYNFAWILHPTHWLPIPPIPEM